MIASLRATSTSDPDEAEPSRGRIVPWGRLIPAGLLLAWLVVLLLHLRVPAPSDQVNYLQAAEAFPDALAGATQTHQVTRFGLVIPTALAVDVFGYSQAAYSVVPVLASLTLVLGCYALGTLLYSRAVGVGGALCVLGATPVFSDATELLPDILAMGLFTCALALAVAIRRGKAPPGKWALMGLGLLLAWSYTAREFIVFLWPLIPVLLYKKVRWAGLVWIAGPIVLIVIAELLLCWRLYGDPLARALAISGHGSAPSTPQVAATYRDKPLHVYLLRLPTSLHKYPEGNLMVGLLGLMLVGALIWRRKLAVLAVSCALMWVPLTLLGGVLDPAAPKLRLQLIRYWFPIFPMFIIGGLAVLWLAAVVLSGRLPERVRGKAALPAVVVLVVATVFTGIAAKSWWATAQTRLGSGTQLEALRSWMYDHDDTYPRLWTDLHTRKILRIYQTGPWGGKSWTTHPIALRPGQNGPPQRGDLVLFFDTENGKVCGQCMRTARQTWGDVSGNRPGWHEVFATPDQVVRLYAID